MVPTIQHREYDLVLLGATGYTASICAEEITKTYPTNTSWAIAGRSEAALIDLAQKLKDLNPDRAPLAIEVVQLEKKALVDFARRTRVLINGVGPYHRYSTPVVEACAENGTNYVDFSTETPWIKEMIDKYHTTAKKSGAILIPAISLSSSPSDLTAYLIATSIRASLSTGTAEVVSSGKLEFAGMSGGSFTTILSVMETYGVAWFLFGSPWAMSAARRPGADTTPLLRRLFGYRFVPGLGALTTSFVAVSNESVVRRSAGLRPEVYGPEFRFHEYLPVPGVLAAVFVHLLTKVGILLFAIPLVRTLLGKLSFKPGTGPDRVESRKIERAEFRAVGTAEGKKGVAARASFVYEGALVDVSAILAVEAAGVLIEKRMPFVERLRKAGVKIEVELDRNVC
ncbi:uncharacterized protein BDZ99DRAFT_572931 [Mytilinidion resinicola]|uniref:Saccharopine dehydrogenase NADP binding domain-containing protein n=1 Tax=Mytilinidion resinicola TaxID=574789 RepID=A0A6A6YGX0_9PEZI|nr:uncharacterized protein BDZ99DRAFT_572931 [Mytilinidion resinicola]KAF2808062.1 hypothetical protein BDZ99DRAFT_572931 [Mytilinidion resinicola]